MLGRAHAIIFGLALLTEACGGSSATSCATQSAALASELHGVSQRCTAIVRVDYQTKVLLGFQLICGNQSSVTESIARETAQSDTGIGVTSPTGQMPVAQNSPSPPDEFVFFAQPADSGGVAVVSAQTGLTVFGGTIMWAGRGDINYPRSWRVASDLGGGCADAGDLGTPRVFDVAGTGDTTTMAAAIASVRRTALVSAMRAEGHGIASAVAVLYPRTVGLFNPAAAEWIVLLNGN